MNASNTSCISEPKTSSHNLQYLKNKNRAATLTALALNKAASRTELSHELGLTRMAISNIINELISESIVQEIPYSNLEEASNITANGRRPKKLILTNWKINSICINIRRYSVSSMLMDVNGNTAYHCSYTLPEKADNQYLIHLLENSIDAIAGKSQNLPIVGIGISSIGPLDIYKKQILNPPDFRDIRDLNIGEILEQKYNLPVFIDNDMNCSSLAEHFWGAGISHRDLVFLGFSSGVGAGIIMNDKIIHGMGGFAGEVGHISINPYGPLCPCGQKGCIELYTRGENILQNTGLKSFAELNDFLDSDNTPFYISKCIDEYLSAMKTLVVTIANSYDPDIVILGDIDKTFISRYISELEEYMNKFMLNHGYKHIPIVNSTLGASAPLYGAGSIVFQRIFNGELSPLNVNS